MKGLLISDDSDEDAEKQKGSKKAKKYIIYKIYIYIYLEKCSERCSEAQHPFVLIGDDASNFRIPERDRFSCCSMSSIKLCGRNGTL